MKSIVQTVFEHSLSTPEKTAIIADGCQISYHELMEKVRIFSYSLKLHSIRKGQRIAIEAHDLIAYFIAFLGCQLSSVIAVPIEENISIYKLQDILKTAKPVLVFMENHGESYQDFLEGNAQNGKIAYPKGDTAAAVIATTGTTGKPVLVTHTNDSMTAEIQNLIMGTQITEETVLFSNVPYNLALGYRRVFAALYAGATAVITRKPLSLELLGRCMEQFNVNYLTIVHAKMNMLLQISDPKLSGILHRLNTVETMAGSITSSQIRSFCRQYPDTALYNVYGATEAGCILIHKVSRTPMENCLGKPAAHAEIAIVDENGARIEQPNQYGYIAARGAMNMSGYYHKKALTDKVMQSGYIVLNDIGYFDEEGFYYYVSRVGDIINTGEHKVIPGDIEQIVSDYRGITDCACAALEIQDSVQVPILYIVCADNDFDMEKLSRYLEKHLEPYKIPREIFCLDEIPRTATGKIIRKSLAVSRTKWASPLQPQPPFMGN